MANSKNDENKPPAGFTKEAWGAMVQAGADYVMALLDGDEEGAEATLNQAVIIRRSRKS